MYRIYHPTCPKCGTEFDYEPYPKGLHPNCKTDWATVDWNRGTRLIAEQLGLPYSCVSRARRRYAPETIWIYRCECRNGPGRKPVYDWPQVNWDWSNAEIARKLGCSSASVCHARRKYAPTTVVKNLGT